MRVLERSISFCLAVTLYSVSLMSSWSCWIWRVYWSLLALSAVFCSFSRVVIWDFFVVMALFICSISSCMRSTSMPRASVS